MKRITAFLMAVLIIATLAIPAFAEEPTTKWYQYTQEECKHNSMIPGDRYYAVCNRRNDRHQRRFIIVYFCKLPGFL